jgi:hypothetical protein
LKPTTIEQIRNQPQPLKDQHQNAVLVQQGAKKETYRVDSSSISENCNSS